MPLPPQAATPLDFAELFAAEDRHFWFRARNRVIGAVVQQLVAGFPAGYRVLEIGCGTGYVLRELERVCDRGVVTGTDLFAEGLQFARQRTRGPLVQADIYDLDFDSPFQLIGMFDVLEHLQDDRRALQAAREQLTDDAALVLTVPAHMHLWSYADENAQHFRRYSIDTLGDLLDSSGFTVEYMTYFMMPLYPLMWLTRRMATWRGTTRNSRELARREFRIVPGVNELLYRTLLCEVPLIRRRVRLPVGTSLLAIARKQRRSSRP